MPSSPSIPEFWEKRGRSLRRLVNLGWFWLYFARMLLAVSVITSLLWWLSRLQGVTAQPAGWLAAGMLIVAGIGARSLASVKSVSLKTALSRLDVGWGLNHRLVSAADGAGPWPDPVGDRPIPLRWRWSAWLPPVGLAAGMLMLAALLPLPAPRQSTGTRPPEPPDWRALETLAEELEQRGLAKEEDVRELRDDLEQLREKSGETWYRPSSLEATDELRSRARADSRRLERGLRQTSDLMALAAARREEASREQMDGIRRRMERMIRQMEQGGMRPGEDLARELQNLDLSNLRETDAARLQQLERQLREQSQALREAMVAAGLGGTGEEEGRTGAGGVDQGGGPSPLTLAEFESAEPPAAPMALESSDPGGARLGDLLELGEGEHRDERAGVAASAGAAASPGGGGEVVWRQDVLPEEENVLREYFK